MSERGSLFDALAQIIGRPRRWLVCRTCNDGGMIEDYRGGEDVCPDCEGGIWRERESWRWWIHRQSWFGLRFNMIGRFRVSKDWPA